MGASPVTLDDLDWVVDVLRRRREALAPHAPVFWRPATDADARHRAYVGHLLTEGGARAWRTEESVQVAAPRLPTYEPERADLASRAGLTIAESWWLHELDGPGGGQAGVAVELPGATAVTVAAPPVYTPPGPVLLLSAPEDLATALPAAQDLAPGLGCAAVVVSQTGQADEGVLEAVGFRRHCDFHEGVIRGTDTLTP